MKVLLLSDTYSEHTEKWALGFANKGIEVGLFSFNKASYEWHTHPNIKVFFEPLEKINAESTITKFSYIKYVSVLKNILKHFKPDLLHAHYATSYGLVGALSGFHPFALSVWGSDVYDFPMRSRLHKNIFKYNLRKADVIMSTSHVMRDEIKKYTKKEIYVTPFGVELDTFYPFTVNKKIPDAIYIGTIKPIEEKYGITYIIEAAKILIDRMPERKFKFMLVGPCNNLEYYQTMIKNLVLENIIEITGRIAFSKINEYHNVLDIFLNVSIDNSESFGVAVVEALACQKPVIVTNVGGLMEVVNHGEFGKVIEKKNSEALAQAILEISNNLDESRINAKKAREFVLKNYDWKNNLNYMLNIYEELILKKQI